MDGFDAWWQPQQPQEPQQASHGLDSAGRGRSSSSSATDARANVGCLAVLRRTAHAPPAQATPLQRLAPAWDPAHSGVVSTAAQDDSPSAPSFGAKEPHSRDLVSPAEADQDGHASSWTGASDRARCASAQAHSSPVPPAPPAPPERPASAPVGTLHAIEIATCAGSPRFGAHDHSASSLGRCASLPPRTSSSHDMLATPARGCTTPSQGRLGRLLRTGHACGIGAPASPCASPSSPFALLDSGAAADGGLCSPRGGSSSSDGTAALHVPTPQRASEGVQGCGLSSASSASSAQLSLEAAVAAPPAAAEPAAPAGPAAAAPAEPVLEFVHSPGGSEMVRDSAELVAAGVREQLGAPRFQHLLELDVAALANQEVQPRTGEQEDGTPASPPPKLQAAHEATDKHLASVQGLRCATACLRPRGSVSSALRVVAGEAAHEQDKGLRYFLAAAHTMWLGLLEQDAPRHAGNTATPQESVKQAVSARVALAQLVERVEKRLQEVEPAGIFAA